MEEVPGGNGSDWVWSTQADMEQQADYVGVADDDRGTELAAN